MYQIQIKEESGEWGLNYEGSENGTFASDSEATEAIAHLQKLWPTAEFRLTTENE